MFTPPPRLELAICRVKAMVRAGAAESDGTMLGLPGGIGDKSLIYCEIFRCGGL